jgi:hypothetical protein
MINEIVIIGIDGSLILFLVSLKAVWVSEKEKRIDKSRDRDAVNRRHP